MHGDEFTHPECATLFDPLRLRRKEGKAIINNLTSNFILKGISFA